MRRAVIALSSAIVVGLMLAPGHVSAATYSVYATDQAGDVPFRWDSLDGSLMLEPLNGNQVMSKAGYMDMTSYQLSYDPDTGACRFEMQLAAALPVSEDDFPSGIKRVEWLLWIDDGAWNPVLSPSVETVFMVNLTFDGEGYVAWLVDYDFIIGDVIASLEFEVTGSTYWVEFSEDLTGNLDEYYWCAATRAWWGGPDTYGMAIADITDWDVAEDQLWYDIPWPSA